MRRTRFQIPPFSIRILDHGSSTDNKSFQDSPDQLSSLLPALHRGELGNLVPAAHNISACVEKELNLDRLARVQKWLWIAGLPLPPRALHHQLLLGRQICITEQMDMHLVWMTGRIFLKPLPRFLLNSEFWVEYLSCEPQCKCSIEGEGFAVTQQECKRRVLRRRALGFLFSYAALLSHESDFFIAKDKHLLPKEVEWPAWRILVDQLDTQNIYPYIDHRFIHGELRLSRLNKIYALYQTPLRGYMARWNQYSAFFHDHFTWLASGTLYIAVVLSAMQVGLATNALEHNKAFQSASYGFTVFSIFGPLITAFIILLLFICAFLFNWAKAHNQKKVRYSELYLLGNP
ncbi:uncharacterized protein MYU51_008211 [Penicillium brevicompactum]|uniref:uncharacterized protein n=1 Tax=Penicillium brevicompactum TaxID=5074 RepID=UPI002540C950|nr:uncharacterized protein N7506_010116 [Penicillium brevicompactum]KAJ5327014.1 hypothetical protein N7506_010116 [Penicillium brevicompactum]